MSIFKGAAVAIITPMTETQEVNYEKLGELIEEQIAGGTDAIVICGTTGESSTLSHEEHLECIRYAVEKTAGRIPVIAGTGSICYGQSTDGREARSGGWGSLMDDEGGGFALGRDALAAAVRAEDGRIAPTVLHDAVFEALQVGAVRELIGKIYAPGFGKREVAALAPLVGAAAEQGDAAALQIVEKAGRELALLVRPVAEKLGLQSARIAFAGSVLQKCAPVRSAAQTQLQTLLPQLTLAEPQGDAAAGAVLLARCKAEE